MRAPIANLAIAQALALAISFTVGSPFVLAENAKDEPTAADLKNSKERNVILLPRAGSSEKTELKPASAQLQTKSVSHIERQKTTKKPPAQANAKTNSVAPKLKPHHDVSPVIQATGDPGAGDSIINVWLDKKGTAPQYKHGDKMKINVSATQDCNVMIFDFDGRGKLTQLYPNEYQQKTLLKAGDTITFGGADSPFDYQVSLPKGSTQAQERIFVYAYPLTEKPLSIALNPADGSPFRSGEMSLAQYKKMVAESKVFFNGSGPTARTSGERDVKIVPKSGTFSPSLKLVSNEDEKSTGQPNKKEVSFTISGN